MNLLLVEDNPGDVVLVQEALRGRPVHLEICPSGEAALDALRGIQPGAARPDLILLDLKMPRMGGLQFLESLKGDVALAAIPVVVLTSSETASDVDRAYALHAAACIAKPSGPYDELLDRILGFYGLATRPSPAARTADTPRRRAPDRPDPHRQSAIVESAADAIIGVDLEGDITSWNAAAEQLFGYTRTEAVGKPVDRIVPDGRAHGVESLLEESPRGAAIQRLRTTRVDRQGREIRIEMTVTPLADELGSLLGKTVFARDITEQWQAEERFRLAVEASPTAMVMVDSDGVIELVNAATEALFGHPRHRLIGERVEILVPERFRSAHPNLREGYVRAPESRAMAGERTLYGVRRDGREVPIEIGLNPMRTSAGLRILCSIVDTTERTRADAMFRLAVEAAPSGITLTDDTGQIILVNAEAERMFGYDRGALIGRNVDELVPRRFRGQHARHRGAYFDAPERRAMGSGRELFGQRADGTEFPVEIGLTPIEAGGARYVLTTIIDITSRRRVEAELAEQREELARSNDELEQFAYVASHDLQEPLRMVSSYASLLARHLGDDLDEDGGRFIEFVLDGASRMRQLIQDLLALSRVRTLAADPIPVRLSECVQAALLNLETGIADSKARIDVEIDQWVFGDPGQLIQVFQNLISNAIKFSGDQAPRISLRAQRDGELVRVSVRDTGIGIAPAHAERIFLPFERLHTRSEYPGTGIGLAICKRVVDRHGGEIRAVANEDAGASFVFTLRAADG